MSEKSRIWTADFTLLLGVAFLSFFTTQGMNNGIAIYVVKNGAGASYAGFLLLICASSAAVTRIFCGHLIDTYTRRLFMRIGSFVFLAGTAGGIIFTGLSIQPLLRFLQGVGFSLCTTAASTAAADVLPRARLGEGIGYHALGQSIGMAIGPATGIALAGMAYTSSLFVGLSVATACLVVLTWLCSYEAHPERLDPTSAHVEKCRKRDEALAAGVTLEKETKRFSVSSFFEKDALSGAIPIVFASAAFSLPATFTALYIAERGFGNSWLFFLLGAITMTAIRLFGSSLFDRVRPIVLNVVAVVVGFVGLSVLAFTHSEAVFCCMGVLWGFAMGVIVPLLSSVTVKSCKPERWGAANGLFYLCLDLGVGIAALVWGAVADATNFTVVYACGAVTMLLSLLVSSVTFRVFQGERRAK